MYICVCVCVCEYIYIYMCVCVCVCEFMYAFVYIRPYICVYMSECRVDTAVGMHYLDANETAGEKARRQLNKNVASNIEQVLAATPHKAPTIRPPASHHKNYPG